VSQYVSHLCACHVQVDHALTCVAQLPRMLTIHIHHSPAARRAIFPQRPLLPYSWAVLSREPSSPSQDTDLRKTTELELVREASTQ